MHNLVNFINYKMDRPLILDQQHNHIFFYNSLDIIGLLLIIKILMVLSFKSLLFLIIMYLWTFLLNTNSLLKREFYNDKIYSDFKEIT